MFDVAYTGNGVGSLGVDRGVGIHGYSGARTAGLLAAVVLLVVVALVPPTELLKSVSWRADWGTWAATSAPPGWTFVVTTTTPSMASTPLRG